MSVIDPTSPETRQILRTEVNRFVLERDTLMKKISDLKTKLSYSSEKEKLQTKINTLEERLQTLNLRIYELEDALKLD